LSRQKDREIISEQHKIINSKCYQFSGAKFKNLD